MLTPKQIAERNKGVFVSELGAVLGLNPYLTAVELYHSKRGTIAAVDLSENTAVEAGNVLEDGIAELAQKHMARKFGRPIKLRRSNVELSHPKYPWLFGHIDRDVVGEDLGVECKNVGANAARGWGVAGTDDIPSQHLGQIHGYMLLKNYPSWVCAAYFGGADLRLYDVQRDPLWDALIAERSHDFWHKNVLAGIPPPLDFDARDALRVVKRLYPGTDGSVVIANEDDEHWFHVLREAKAMAKMYENTAEGALAHLCGRMKDAAILQLADDGRLTRKSIHRKAYAVEEKDFMQTRVTKPKSDKGDDDD